MASILPRANLDGRTSRAHLGQAVLRSAVRYYGRRGGNSLRGLIELLAAMPDGVSELDNAAKIGGDLARTLTAAMVNDPLFGSRATPLDPGVMLTPPAGKKARISVVSFIGLPSDDQRQSFVNQLQMALFAWIKRRPALDRPLGGLFVMDEAQTLATSGAMTAPDISLLKSGEFYLAAEGHSFTKIRTPLCLSYHPRAPLTTEEVIALARGQNS